VSKLRVKGGPTWLVALVLSSALSSAPSAWAQDPTSSEGDAQTRTGLGVTEEPSVLEGRFAFRNQKRSDRLRTLRDGRSLGHMESATYAPFRSWRRGAAIYEGAFDSRFLSGKGKAAAAEAELELGRGRFRWKGADGERRELQGIAVRATARVVALRLEGETAGLVIPSGLGRFDSRLEGAANASIEAKALAVGSWGKEGGDLQGVAVAGAFAEASLALPVEVDMAGVKTRIRARASGYAGVGFKGAFRVRFDPKSGRLELSGDLGAVLGVGGGVGVSVDVDAGQLLSRLGFTLPPSGSATPTASPRAPPATPPSGDPSGLAPGWEDRLHAPPPPGAEGLVGALEGAF
jgi:hypothetical protein